MNDFAILISSCDKYSDLWVWNIQLLEKHWNGPLPDIYLITDKKTDFFYNGVTILFFDGNMPSRIKKALQHIDKQSVLVTLDDYFVIGDIDLKRLLYLFEYSQINGVDYLSIYNRKFARGYDYKRKEIIQPIDLKQDYAVNLYPAIWNKTFLIKCIDEDITPWLFEPKLTKKAIDLSSVCEEDRSGCFLILDVIRKGKVLRKADKYFRRNDIHLGDRPLTARGTELKLAIMDFIKFHTPRWFYRFLKKIAMSCGMKFYNCE